MRHCTITDACKLFQLDQQARRLTTRTQEFYEWKLAKFVDWCKKNGVTHIDKLTATHIKTFLVYEAGRGMADYTIRGSAMAIRAFCRFCVRDELLSKSPFTGVIMPREPDRILPAFNKADIPKLLKAAKNYRDKAIVLVLLDTGLRAAELLSLNGGDVNLEAGEIVVRKGKGNKGRIVYIGARARKALTMYYMRRGTPKPDGPVIRNENNGKTRLTSSRLFKACKTLGERAGITPCTPHRFRRTFAIEMARAGVNIHMIAKLMGHKGISVLKRYLDINQKDLEEAHKRASPADNLF